MPHPTFGTAQLLILTAVATSGPGPFDLRGLQRGSHHQEALSRAVHRLVDDGVLVWLRKSPDGQYVAADGWVSQIRYVRRAGC